MADWFRPIVDEIHSLCLATWDDIGADADKLWMQVPALERNIVSQAAAALNKADPTKIAPPIAIICMGKVVQEKGLSVDPFLFRLPLVVAYIAARPGSGAEVDMTLQEWVHARANLLWAAMKAQTFATFQVFGDDTGDIDSSAEIAFAEESLKLLAGEVRYSTGLLVRLGP